MTTGRKVVFSPSMMCSDIFRLESGLVAFEKYCNMLHIDIMDGHFAPNLALSMDYMKALKKRTHLPLDAHLMVERPNDLLDEVIRAEPEYITVHAETIRNCAFRTIQRIKAEGIKAGVAICPATPLEEITAYLDNVDMVLQMTVDIGYAGQSFIHQTLGKIKCLNRIRQERGLNYLIQADGCIGKPVYRKLFESGADVYVMGSAGLFNRGFATMEEACRNLYREFSEETGMSLEYENCVGK